MKSGIGIDAGTFHTVAVSAADAIHIPSRSIPSIALRASDTLIVGIDAIPQLDLPFELILAPKLRLSSGGNELKEVIRKLVGQALKDLGSSASNVVLTVPPGWSLEDCAVLEEAVSPLGIQARFLHEPIALLIAAMYVAPKLALDSETVAKLDNPKLVMVCDWGAGTVDLALVQVSRSGDRHEFVCIGESTEMGQGATSIARDIVRKLDLSSGEGNSRSVDKDAYRLQAHWQGDKFAGVDFSQYTSKTKKRRKEAVKVICEKIADLIEQCEVRDRKGILFLLYGGSFESEELRTFLMKELNETIGIDDEQYVHIGSSFTSQLHDANIPWRRDALVAAGASLFASRGEVLPEFEYQISLIDSFGHSSSHIRLARSHNLAGIQVITPPYTGVDYSVGVQQMRGDSVTSIRTQLRLHLRESAVVMYRIREAGVGYAMLEALEAQNLPCPIPFADSRSDFKRLPERSTKFIIDLE